MEKINTRSILRLCIFYTETFTDEDSRKNVRIYVTGQDVKFGLEFMPKVVLGWADI